MHRDKFLMNYMDDNNSKTAYDPFEPEWDCEVQDRVGTRFGDGGKFVCGIRTMRLPCLVYSFGSRGNDDFERGIKAYRPSCEIHVFDPTESAHPSHSFKAMEAKGISYNYSFHPWGLSSEERAFGTGAVYPLSTIMSKLHHENRTIDILKVDCEGCEFDAFRLIFESCVSGKLTLGQVQIELHGTSRFAILHFFKGAEKCGLSVFHKERNHWGCHGYRCVEFSLISSHMALQEYIASHCPRAQPDDVK